MQLADDDMTAGRWHADSLRDCYNDDTLWGYNIWVAGAVEQEKTCMNNSVLYRLSLGTRASLPGWYIASTSQGNGQSTWDIPTQSIPSTFRIFPVSVPAISLAWGIARTFTVSQVT